MHPPSGYLPLARILPHEREPRSKIGAILRLERAAASGLSRIRGKTGGKTGRSERIRTSDPHVPNVVRYQTALHSDCDGTYRRARLGPQARVWVLSANAVSGTKVRTSACCLRSGTRNCQTAGARLYTRLTRS